jgi:hypothetical protein
MKTKLYIKLISAICTLTININSIEIREIEGLNSEAVISALTERQRLYQVLEKNHRMFSRWQRVRNKFINQNRTLTSTLQMPFVYPIIAISYYYTNECKSRDLYAIKKVDENIQELCELELGLTYQESSLLLEKFNTISYMPGPINLNELISRYQ